MRRAPLLLAALMGAALLAPLAPAAQARAAAPAAPVVSVAEDYVAISPNGDGRRDRAAFHVHLDRAASVTVEVSRDGTVEQRYRLGRWAAGGHVWRWNGRLDGARAADGRYAVSFAGTAGGREGSASAVVRVDTRPDRGSLTTSRSTVYPVATAVADRVLVQYLRQDWDAEVQANHELPLLDVRFRIEGPGGDMVARREVEHSSTAGFEWYGRGAGGAPVAAGGYVVRARVEDPAGNVSHFARRVTVSHEQLHAEVVTVASTTGIGAERWSPSYPASCLGCGDACSAYASDVRFPGGLALGCTSFSSLALLTATVPFTAAPVDSFRVTAVGGPHVVGSPDVATLAGSITMGPGDSTATTPWLPVYLGGQPYLPDRSRPLSWAVSSAANAYYDFASFTVEYRRWVP